MDDGLDIPEFLRRKPPTPEEQAKLRRKWEREAKTIRSTAVPQTDFKLKLDKQGRALPRSMDAGSWALLAEVEKADKIKEKENKAAENERFRLLAIERKERAAIKRAAKEAQKGYVLGTAAWAKISEVEKS